MATIKKRGNSYFFRCYAGYNAAGKQMERTMTWNIPAGMSDKKAEKEAIQQAALFEERVRNGQTAEKHIKFQDFTEKWFSDHAEIQLRPTTIKRYRQFTDRVYPALGHLYIDKIRPAHLMSFYKDLANIASPTKYRCKIDFNAYMKDKGLTNYYFYEAQGIGSATITGLRHGGNIEKNTAQRICATLDVGFNQLFIPDGEGKSLSERTILHYHRFISTVLESAVKWQYIPANPCARVDPPKVHSKEAPYLDLDQTIHLLDLLQSAPMPYRCAVTVLLYTGMRRGELLGLEWSDIDFAHCVVSINKSSLYLPERGIFTDETKNSSSSRFIKVPQAAIDSFIEMRKWQSEHAMKLGDAWKGNNFNVFTSSDGSPLFPDSLTGWFHDFIEKTDLPQIHIHSLRHTNATLNIANGVSVTTVAGQLGHSSASTTTKIYAHAIKQAQAAAADMMNDLLSSSRAKKQA